MLKISHLQLADVQQAFEAWRQHGRARTTPPALRAQAVQLLAEYSVRAVIRALHVDHWRFGAYAKFAIPSYRIGRYVMGR